MLGLVARSITTKSSFLQRGAAGGGGGVFAVAAGRSGGSCITTGSQHQHQQQNQSYLQYEQRHSYVSRAHPQRLPEYPIGAALQMVLEETQERYAERAAKWERNAPVRMSKGKQVRCTVQYQVLVRGHVVYKARQYTYLCYELMSVTSMYV